jgi:hypothetical protein
MESNGANGKLVVVLLTRREMKVRIAFLTGSFSVHRTPCGGPSIDLKRAVLGSGVGLGTRASPPSRLKNYS